MRDLVERLLELAETAPDPRPMSAAMREAADRIGALESLISRIGERLEQSTSIAAASDIGSMLAEFATLNRSHGAD